ncbi:hypothetical protein L6E12_02035 [Actinokineospora sp. PR83]|uniref:hypothetical protein n=1 Tax=Actinokineospora sp. PR83 TaxID=2884908 RepID=UPI001F3F4D96|nr:hypothetical protein [Actinokineospora sp. PR83]MCG8914575.1 hypothetical protein [Actinokineospora sp. PR83]
MSRNPSNAWRPVIGVVAAAMALVSGCGVEPIRTPAFSPTTTSTTPPPAPVKYSPTGWKGCQEVQRKLGGDLPPPRPEDEQEGPGWSLRICSFQSDAALVVLSIQYWETTEDITGTHPGAERAEEDFLGRGQAREEDSGLGLGSAARWKRDDTTGCTLEILDGNAVVSVAGSNPKDPAEGRTEQCRGRVRELAKQFHAAVQPQ